MEIPTDMFEPSGERAVAVISGILHNKWIGIESGVVYNQSAISNLPNDLAVEVPVMLNASGIHPVSVGPLPDGIAKLLLMQARVQHLSVDVAVHAKNWHCKPC